MSDDEKPSLPQSATRVAAGALIVATIPTVTECSEADGHLRAALGPAQSWATVNADEHSLVWLPDNITLLPNAPVGLALLLVVAVAFFALAEWKKVGRGATVGAALVWGMAWLGVLFPLPLLFVGFFAHYALAPMVLLGMAAERSQRRGRRKRPRGPPSG